MDLEYIGDADPAAVANPHGALGGAPLGAQRGTAVRGGVNGARTRNPFDWRKL